MKKLIIGLIILFPTVVFAAPTTSYFFNIAPTITNTYNNGSLTNEWLNVFSQTSSSTNLIVSGLGGSTGCLTPNVDGSITTTACAGGSSTFGTSSLSALWPIIYTQSSSLAQFSFGGLSTTTPWLNGQLAYVNSGNTITSVSTTTVSCSGSASCTPFTVIGGSPVTISATSGGGGSFPFSADTNYAQVVYSTSTPTLWFKSGFFASSTIFAPNQIDNINSTNSTSTNATTTQLAIIGTASNCNGGNALTTSSSGLVTCTAQPQGTVTSISIASANGFAGSSSGGATPALTLSTSITGLLKGNGTALSAAAYTDFPTIAANTILGNVTAGTASPTALATSSQLFTGTAGQVNYFIGTNSLFATSSLFIAANGNVGIASTTPYSALSVGTGAASSSITVAEYKYGKSGNIATSTTQNIDCNASTQIAEPIGTSALTLTLINLIPGKKCIVVIQNPHGGTAGAVTWAVQTGFTLTWAGATKPTQTTTADTYDIWSFLATQGSSTVEIVGAATTNIK